MQKSLSLFLKAMKFSAEKHRDQRRKDKPASPYINHPIDVANMLWTIGEVYDVVTIVGALLHDTLEDTDTTHEEIITNFSEEVLALVLEVSDDKNMTRQERKQHQVEDAPFLSDRAKQIKLADKICNISDVVNFPPAKWTRQRRIEYLEWANSVVAGLRGVNPQLETCFDEIITGSRQELAREKE